MPCHQHLPIHTNSDSFRHFVASVLATSDFSSHGSSRLLSEVAQTRQAVKMIMRVGDRDVREDVCEMIMANIMEAAALETYLLFQLFLENIHFVCRLNVRNKKKQPKTRTKSTCMCVNIVSEWSVRQHRNHKKPKKRSS